MGDKSAYMGAYGGAGSSGQDNAGGYVREEYAFGGSSGGSSSNASSGTGQGGEQKRADVSCYLGPK